MNDTRPIIDRQRRGFARRDYSNPLFKWISNPAFYHCGQSIGWNLHASAIERLSIHFGLDYPHSADSGVRRSPACNREGFWLCPNSTEVLYGSHWPGDPKDIRLVACQFKLLVNYENETMDNDRTTKQRLEHIEAESAGFVRKLTYLKGSDGHEPFGLLS